MSTRHASRRIGVSWSGVGAVLVVWQAVSTSGVIDPVVFPGPVEVVWAALTLAPPERVLVHVRSSLVRIVWGFALGAGLGVLIGVASGWYRRLGHVLRAPIELLRPIPPLAWIPMAIIWFGLGEASKVFIIFLGAFFPVVTNAHKGMIGIDPDLFRAAQTLGVRGWRLLLRVALPAVLPDLATGVRVGWSLSFGALVAAELIAADRGLGFMIMNARELGQISVIMYGIIVIGALNFLTDWLMRELLFKRRLRWHFGA
ncbi:MAG: ABC transporter permease [Armatimonadota bacterium]|nr:ABC transporter permease [Armatimonadota bacterium]